MDPAQPGTPAETYEQYFVPAMFRPWAAALLQHAALRPSERVLDVADRLSLPLAAVMTPFALSSPEELRSLFLVAGYKAVEIRPESIAVRFPDAPRFVPLAAMSSAAAVPAFSQLAEPERRALLENVRADVEPTLCAYREGSVISFPMYANIAVATR